MWNKFILLILAFLFLTSNLFAYYADYTPIEINRLMNKCVLVLYKDIYTDRMIADVLKIIRLVEKENNYWVIFINENNDLKAIKLIYIKNLEELNE